MTRRRPKIAGISIRPLRRAQVCDFRDGLAWGKVAATTRLFFPRSQAAMMGWYDEIVESKETHAFAVMHRKKFIGMGSLRPPLYSGRELTIAIFDSRYHGAGVGTFAVTKLCDFGFGRLKLHRIELGVYPTNKRAIACYDRIGFKYEALLRNDIYHEGQWQDVIWMSFLRSEWEELR